MPAPLPGARGYSAFKGRNSRLQHACKKFLGVRATASCPPPTRQSLPVVLVLHGAIHRQASGKVIVYSVCGEWHAERPCGVEPWRRVRHEHDRRDLNVGFSRWRDPTKRNVGFSPFPFFSLEKRKLSAPFSFLLQGCPVTTFHQIQMKLPRLMHLNGSQISANIHITTEDKVVRRCTNKQKNIIDRCCS